jgi:hypothetical protein
MKIHVHIEHLVLDGLPLSWKDSNAVRLAVQRELAEMLRVPGKPASAWIASPVARVSAGSVQCPAEPGPGAFGRDLAHSIGAVIRR